MARQMVGVRLSEAGVQEIEKIAESVDVKKAVVLRVILGEAMRSPEVMKKVTTRLNAMRETL